MRNEITGKKIRNFVRNISFKHEDSKKKIDDFMFYLSHCEIFNQKEYLVTNTGEAITGITIIGEAYKTYEPCSSNIPMLLFKCSIWDAQALIKEFPNRAHFKVIPTEMLARDSFSSSYISLI